MNNVLIVFTDPHLAYSPSILNLFYELKKITCVKLISPEPHPLYSLQRVDDQDIIYFDTEEQYVYPRLYNRILNKVKNRLSPPTALQVHNERLKTQRAKKIIEFVKNFEGKILVVDFFALWCVQQAGRKAHLFSLEIHENDPYRSSCNYDMIESVVIQSYDRYYYLFQENQIKYFIVQNAPPFINFAPNYIDRDKNDLIFCGSAVPWFGIISCLDFIKDYPEYTLTIKGAVPKATKNSIELFYKDLITNKRLIIDEEYLDAETLTAYVSKFRIGFAFYDFYRFEQVRSFNYFTAPSGKVFQYLNSGVPVVANDLKGFELLKVTDAGVLVPSLSSKAIKTAIDEIESSYLKYAQNAKLASKEFDYLGNIKTFINFLTQGN